MSLLNFVQTQRERTQLYTSMSLLEWTAEMDGRTNGERNNSVYLSAEVEC